MKKLLDDAETIIKNASGDCAKLLRKDALARFQKLRAQFRYAAFRELGEGTVPLTSAARTHDSANVYLNPIHYVFNPDTRALIPIPKGISRRDREFLERQNAPKEFWANEIKETGVSEYSYAVGAILHEFLHQIGQFKPHEVGTRDSTKQQREVVRKCIKGNEPKQ